MIRLSYRSVFCFILLTNFVLVIRGFNIETNEGMKTLTPAASQSTSGNPSGGSSAPGSTTGSDSNPAFFGYDINLSKDEPPVYVYTSLCSTNIITKGIMILCKYIFLDDYTCNRKESSAIIASCDLQFAFYFHHFVLV